MLTFIALIIAILLQFIAAIIAISLTKKTKYNISWILISLGLVFMAIRRFFEIMPYLFDNLVPETTIINHWIGIAISIVISIGVIFVKKIFKFLGQAQKEHLEYEKHVLTAIIQTEEKERKRFAKDLHDGLGPLLSTVKMSISALSQIEHDDKSKKIITNTEHVLNEAINSIKEISNNLSPHILNNFGLESAINNFCNKINQTKKINVDFKSNILKERFNSNVELILYRVICELINNTTKHANAQNIKINLTRHAKILTIQYADDGKGFDINQIEITKRGLGLSNIKSRIKSVNGVIIIESNEGLGFSALIKINV
ncbi:MAG: sensor histidine kinase [Bacteroidales bacterium]|nr:sensor histidine kinase [Bacteroidales bacterium]